MIFYTYLWLREQDGTFPEGTPYYVGKGKDYRGFSSKKHSVNRPKNNSSIRVMYWSDEATALAFEMYLIDYYGRIDLGTGCLRNRTYGGDTAINLSEEGRQKMRDSGKRAQESGQLDVARSLRPNMVSSGRVLSSKYKHLLTACRTKEHQTKAGRLGGKRNYELGNLTRAGAIGGKIVGRMNAESGRMIEVQKTSNHIRWHVNRDIIRDNCPFCKESQCHT